MSTRFVTLFAAVAVVAVPAGAQNLQRRANMVGGGSSDYGKCTVEVVVDGAADVEIRGDAGFLRNLSGGQPIWRRFECTSPLPANPVQFRFAGIDGRGRQQLVRDPRNGGAAVVRIEDSEGGAEAYTFDLEWGGNRGFNTGVNGGDPRYAQRDRVVQGRMAANDAIRVCEDSVRQQAWDRFHSRDVVFRRTRIDDNPGRNDWVIGTIDVPRRGGQESYRFSCSVNFDTGRVKSVNLDPMDRDRDRDGSINRGEVMNPRAMQNCQAAVQQRMANDGYGRVDFSSINVDNNPGRNDWIVGTARAARGRYTEQVDFSCSVNLRDGDVRSVDIRKR